MTLKYSLYVFLLVLTVAVSLLAGIGMQPLNMGFAMFLLSVGGIWIVIAVGTGMSLRSTLIMLSTFFMFPFPITFYLALALLVICLVVEYYKTGKGSLSLPYPLTFFILAAFGLFALTKTTVQGGILYFIASVAVPLLVFLIISNITPSAKDLDTWMRAIVFVSIFLAVYGIMVALQNPDQRIGSTWSNAMTINGLYTVAFFFAIALGIKSEVPLNRFAWMVSAIVIFLGMLFTYTRIAMVAVVFGLLLLMLKQKRIRLAGVLAIGVIPLIIPTSMMQRGDVGSFLDISIIIRLIAWAQAVGVIARNPLTGIGFSTWKDMYHGMIPVPFLYAVHAHNVYLNLLLEMGIVGTIAYFTIIGKTLSAFYRKVALRGADTVHYTVFVGVMALLFACLTDIFIQQYTISLFFWITLALMHNAATAKTRQSG